MQSTTDKTIFRTVNGCLYINTHLRVYLFCRVGCHVFPSWELKALLQLPGSLLVLSKQFQCPIAHRELLWQVFGTVHLGRQGSNLLLNYISVVNVYVAYSVVLSLEQLDNGVEQLVEPASALCHSRNHGNTHHGTKVLVVDCRATCQHFVVHVQRYNRAQVHVDELGGEVKIALEVRCYH